MTKRTVRDVARDANPLGGRAAQGLESALTKAEQERDAAIRVLCDPRIGEALEIAMAHDCQCAGDGSRCLPCARWGKLLALREEYANAAAKAMVEDHD